MTVNKEMVHGLPITTEHTAPLHQRETPSHKVIQSENPT